MNEMSNVESLKIAFFQLIFKLFDLHVFFGVQLSQDLNFFQFVFVQDE